MGPVLLQQNPPVLNWECQLTQVIRYIDHKMAVVAVFALWITIIPKITKPYSQSCSITTVPSITAGIKVIIITIPWHLQSFSAAFPCKILLPTFTLASHWQCSFLTKLLQNSISRVDTSQSSGKRLHSLKVICNGFSQNWRKSSF